jgi:hypothetical protein
LVQSNTVSIWAVGAFVDVALLVYELRRVDVAK